MDASSCAGDTPPPLSDPNKAQEAPATSSTPAEKPAAASAGGDAARGASESNPDAPPAKKRRRRRRGGRKKNPEAKANPAAQAAPQPSQGAAAPLDPGLAALAGGLLSHIDDREVPCANDGCHNLWSWTAAEQIAAYGQAPPRRECDQCKSTAASEVRCSVDGCKRTWTWTREAQIKHRSWKKRRGDERGKKRRRRGDGAPRRKCDLCQAKLGKLADRPSVCKVHGCTRPVMVDRDAQLRAWASSGSKDLESEAPLPKQMCEVCREFCRAHDDRAVPCGRPGCDKSWTYKRGAQLQAFLAGRFEDPIRLCESCESETRKAAHGSTTPANVEVMPCIVPGCDGTWHYRPGQKLRACQDGDQPVDRMCDEHRQQHGAPPRVDRSTPAAKEDTTPQADSGTALEGQNAPTEPAAEAPVESSKDSPESDREITTSVDPIS